MKNLKSKVLLLTLALSILICGIVAITASAANSEASSEPSVSIYKKNVSFTSSPCIVFAVAYDNCNKADLTMTVVDANDENATPKMIKSSFDVTIGGKSYPAFALDGVNPKDVAKEYLVYVSVDGTDVKSDVVKYSILQFALEGMLATSDAAEYARYESIVTYAKSVQTWLSPNNFSGTAADEYFYLDVTDAKDVMSGIYAGSKEITLEYDATSLSSESITGWMLTTNEGCVSASTVVANSATVTIDKSTKITPVFAPTETFDNGYGSYISDISSADRVNVQNGMLAMTTNNGSTDSFRVSFMNESTSKTYIFQSDIYVDFNYALDSDVGTEDHLYIRFENASKVEIAKIPILKGDTSSSAKIALYNDYGSDGTITDWIPVTLANNSFTLKAEVYYFDTYSVLKIYINGELVGVSEINKADNLSFVKVDSTNKSEFLAKFDNMSFYKADKAYTYQTPGLYENFEDGVADNITNETPSGAVPSIETVIGADGESTKAYVLNKTANGNDNINIKLTSKANTTLVYQADMMFKHTDGDPHISMTLGTAATTGDYAYRFNMYYNEDGVFNIRDRVSTGTHGATVTTSVKKGEWFNFRLEYTEISDTEILVVIYINNEIVYVSDNYYTQTNTRDDCTWPVFGPSGTHITSNNNTWGTVSLLRIFTNNTTKGEVVIDNILAQTIPTPDYDFADSDYTNRFHAPAAE